MNKPLKHHQVLITAKVNNPPGKEDLDYAETWLKELIDAIGMNLLAGPISAYVDMKGNEGMTIAAIIETSHIAMHIWDAEPPASVQMHVYSCSTLDPTVVMDYLSVFDLEEYEYKFIDRENGFKELHTKKWKKEHTL